MQFSLRFLLLIVLVTAIAALAIARPVSLVYTLPLSVLVAISLTYGTLFPASHERYSPLVNRIRYACVIGPSLAPLLFLNAGYNANALLAVACWQILLTSIVLDHGGAVGALGVGLTIWLAYPVTQMSLYHD